MSARQAKQGISAHICVNNITISGGDNTSKTVRDI